MKKIKELRRRVIVVAVFVIAMIFVSLSSEVTYAENYTDCQYLSGNNVGDNNYVRWSSPIESYLTTKDSGYMRVQGNVSGQGIVAAYYDADFKLLSRRTIASELPLFGSFYETAGNYFIVSGQTNTEQDNSKEVYRITKYDKNWNKIGSCGLYGANTTVPFDAGSCRMHHSGNYLIIRTSHKMYKSSDGLNHQANVTIQVDTGNMKVTDSYTDVTNNSYGYVSHSFNQFIKLENNRIVAVDHGDAYPRSICLMEYPTDISSGKFTPTYSNPVITTNVLSFLGNIGNNTTGASVGGFEISGTSYLIAGNSVVQDDSNTSRTTRNVFVASVNKSNKSVKLNWLTNYNEGEDSCSTPHMVQLPNNEYMVLWSRSGSVYYVRINGSGQKVGQIYSMEGKLSDCVPLVSNGRLIWYTWNNSKEIFYQIPLNNLANPTSIETVYDHDYEHIKTENGLATLKCKKCDSITTGKVPTSFYLFWNKTEYGSYSTYFPSCDIDDTPYYMFDNFGYSAEADITLNDMVLESDNPANCMIDADAEKVAFREAGTYTFKAYPKYNPTVVRTHVITVTRKTCQHNGGKELRNKVAATCVNKGYTGDEYCLICGEEIERGSETEIDGNNHAHTTVLPGIAATIDNEGLTEGATCDSCGVIIRKQQIIPKLDPTGNLSSEDKANVAELSSSLGITTDQAVKIINYAKSNGISPDTLKITEKTVTTGNTDKDLKGSKFAGLQACAKKNAKTLIVLKWKEISNADGYLIYGNKCGAKNKMRLLATIESNKTVSYTQKKLEKGTYYKYIVVAYKNIEGTNVTIAASPTIHSVTKGGKFGVAKSVKVTKVGNKKGASATLNKGKTAKIVAKEIKADKKIKKHRKLAYESSNTNVATVSKNGVIKAVGKGGCKIYVYAQNGASKAVNVRVK